MEQNSLTTKFLEDLLRSGGDLAFPASMEASSLAPTGAPLISLYFIFVAYNEIQMNR